MAYNPEEDIKVSDLPEKTTNVVSDDKLLVIDSEDANILKQVDASKVGGGGSGTGDMLKSVYDTNNNGIVDNSEALGGFPASDYAKSADVQPTLESGVNIKTINGNSILGDGNIEIGSGGTISIDNTMSDTSENAVQNKVIKAYVDSQSGGGGDLKVFNLTGTYNDSSTSLTNEDAVIARQAIQNYIDNGILPVLIMNSDRFFFPENIFSTGGFFREFVLKEKDGVISQRKITVYSDITRISFEGERQESSFGVIEETQIDDLNELTFSIVGNDDNYALKTIFQFTITIKQGNTVIKRYNGISVNGAYEGKSMQRYFGGNEAYTKYESQNQRGGIFNLNDSTNRGSMKCYLSSNGVGDKKLYFVDKNKTQSGNSIFIEGILFFNY